MNKNKILVTAGIAAGIAGTVGGVYIANRKCKLHEKTENMRDYFQTKKEFYDQVGDGESPFLS